MLTRDIGSAPIPTLHQSDTASECSDSPVARQQHWSTYFAHVDPCMEILRYWENDCLGEALQEFSVKN